MRTLRIQRACLAAAAAALAGCAAVQALSPPPEPASAAPVGAAGWRYRCEQNLAIRVELNSDSATVDAGARGKEVLLRDAGGLTPQHTVFSNPRLRAEFGVGPEGREALLHWLQPQPESLRCELT